MTDISSVWICSREYDDAYRAWENRVGKVQAHVESQRFGLSPEFRNARLAFKRRVHAQSYGGEQ